MHVQTGTVPHRLISLSCRYNARRMSSSAYGSAAAHVFAVQIVRAIILKDIMVSQA